MIRREKEILLLFDDIISKSAVRLEIDKFVSRVEEKLRKEPDATLVWESIPLTIYGKRLPDVVRSSWVFIVPSNTVTGAERHPKSHQRMMSYRGSGDLQIWKGERWHSNILVSNLDEMFEKRWISISPNVWHQAVGFKGDWVVISFHTVLDKELIEERPDPEDTKLTQKKRYMGNIKD